jgi:hypothetical protein
VNEAEVSALIDFVSMEDNLRQAVVQRSRGIKNRMEFFRRALGHDLKEPGAEDAAVLLAKATAA